MASLTETAKAVLQGKTLEEGYGAAYPSVGNGSVSNPNPVDPSTASTANAKTLHPGTKAKEERHGQNGSGSSDTGAFPGAEDLGGATPTSLATGNLGAVAAGKTGKDNTRSGQASVKAEPKKTLKSQPQSMAEDEEIEETLVYPYDLWVQKRINDPERDEMIQIAHILPKDGMDEFVVALSQITKKDKCQELLSSKGVAEIDRRMDLLRRYVNDWVRFLQEQDKAEL